MTNLKKPLLLLSNDDGIDAEGLKQLTGILRGLGDLVVFAPDGPRSGMSRAITVTEPVRCKLLKREDRLTVYSCTGTPADCVKLAVSEILPVKPDLLIAGINHGGNQALSVHYSGTLGAAFEGCVYSIPSLGVSLENCQPGSDFSQACRLARTLAEQMLKHGLPNGVYLNLNVPDIAHVKGISVGRQTEGKWVREYRTERDADGETLYRLTGDYETSGPGYADNDVTLLDGGYASLVPCRVDVTDYAFMEELKTWTFRD
ncbi:MAG: 5'/3'-nucleotidase SurE [Tannerella sp.]|jgi:5'-nucleotidase|nr:5'/3'-nucleotidase SurE [Tannerella sp.]